MIQLENKLYTSTEVAEILGVSLRSVYRYLEENKLDAEVKTATGRHRFSKQNILDFLYPNGENSSPRQLDDSTVKEDTKSHSHAVSSKIPSSKSSTDAFTQDFEVSRTVSSTSNASHINSHFGESKKEDTPNVEESVEKEEEPIDWLAKFREAAKKFKEESDTTAQPQVGENDLEETTTFSRPVTPRYSSEPAFVENISETPVHTKKSQKRVYYRSALGGLKDIAQNIDKSSRNSFLDYAFTLNAGLSLYKPIKPFSMLHAYVRPGDVSFFERVLSLTATDESNAQLCLITSDDDSIYADKDELHGLFVVAKQQLIEDVREIGDSALTAEAQTILK